MKTKLELQAELIEILDRYFVSKTRPSMDELIESDKLKSEIAELEKQGIELPPVEKQQQKELIIESFEREQSGKSAEEIINGLENIVTGIQSDIDFNEEINWNLVMDGLIVIADQVEQYHKERMREELLKFIAWVIKERNTPTKPDIGISEFLVDEYLKNK